MWWTESPREPLSFPMSADRRLPRGAQCGPGSLHCERPQHLAQTALAPPYHLWASPPMPEPQLGSSCLARDPWGLGRHSWSSGVGRGEALFIFYFFCQSHSILTEMGLFSHLGRKGRYSRWKTFPPPSSPTQLWSRKARFGTQDNHPGPPAPPIRLCPYSAWMSCLCCQGNLPSLAVTPLELDSCT